MPLIRASIGIPADLNPGSTSEEPAPPPSGKPRTRASITSATDLNRGVFNLRNPLRTASGNGGWTSHKPSGRSNRRTLSNTERDEWIRKVKSPTPLEPVPAWSLGGPPAVSTGSRQRRASEGSLTPLVPSVAGEAMHPGIASGFIDTSRSPRLPSPSLGGDMSARDSLPPRYFGFGGRQNEVESREHFAESLQSVMQRVVLEALEKSRTSARDSFASRRGSDLDTAWGSVTDGPPEGIMELSSAWADIVRATLSKSQGSRQNISAPSSGASTPSMLRRGGATFIDLIEGPTRRSFSSVLKSRMVSPSSRARLAWDLLGALFLVWDLVIVPLQCFDLPYSTGIWAFNLVTTCFWTLDIITSFFVGYHFKGFVIMDPKRVAMRYLKSWFFLDLVIVTMDWQYHFLQSEGYASALGKVSRGLRAVRLLRVAKLQTLLSEVNLKAIIRSEVTRTLLGILKTICAILVLNHFMACGFYGLQYVHQMEHTWVAANFRPADNLSYRYWTSVHWSLTQFTPASMEVVPVNTFERCYAVAAVLLALMCISTFVSSVTSTMTKFGNRNLAQQHQSSVLYHFLGQRSISMDLVNRVWHYLNDRDVNYRQARTREEDVELFAFLPESLKLDLHCEMYMPALTWHPFFRQYSQLDAQAVRALCKSAIKEYSLRANEELFGDRAGQVAVSHMFFLTEGVLMYSYPESEAQSCVWLQSEVHAGEWACEAALWAVSLSLAGPYVAAEDSELLLLSAAEFAAVARKFPQSSTFATEYGAAFMEYVKDESRECKWSGSLSNSRFHLQDLVTEVMSNLVHEG